MSPRFLFLALGILRPLVGLAVNPTNAVPELVQDSYQLVYELPIKSFKGSSVPYRIDRAARIEKDSFDRVAYFLDLEHNDGSKKWVWVSFDALSPDPALIGVPATSAHTQQRIVNNMNVFASANARVTSGTGITTGNVEFWSFNYSHDDGGIVPGDEGAEYGFDDRHTGQSHYGSMQVHNHGAGETLFAYNAWRQTGDLGIGTVKRQGNKRPDWTFWNNAGKYTRKTLQVYVRPKLRGLVLRLEKGDHSLGPFPFEAGAELSIGGSLFELQTTTGGAGTAFTLHSRQTGRRYGPFQRKPGTRLPIGHTVFVIER